MTVSKDDISKQVSFAKELAEKLSWYLSYDIEAADLLEVMSSTIFRLELDETGVVMEAAKALYYEPVPGGAVDLEMYRLKKLGKEE